MGLGFLEGDGYSEGIELVLGVVVGGGLVVGVEESVGEELGKERPLVIVGLI